VSGSQNTIDSTVRGAHRDIQALAHSHKCQTGLAYDTIISDAKAEMDGAVVAAKLAVASLPAETSKKGNGKGKGKP
jgi:hypothetical protein